MVLGLRFARRDARRLSELAAQVRNGELSGQAANVFDQAALAAQRGEPLEVHCVDPVEVVHLAVAYVCFGVTRPVIEELRR